MRYFVEDRLIIFLTTDYNENKRASAKSLLSKYVKGAPI